MNIATNIASTKNSIGFLPEMCTPQAVLRVMVGAEVLAIVLALTSASATYQASLVKLGLTSLFVQWVALSSTLTVCLLANKIKRLKVINIAVSLSTIVIAFTIGASILAIMADSYQKVGVVYYWDTPFIFRNVFIALVLSVMASHYFYVHSQRAEFSRADSGAKYDALQSRMRPHFLFNSLNSIAQLIQVDKDKAEDALLDLADIFRSTLDTRNRISLGEELDVTLRYLRMEGLRLGKRRLNIVWDMDRQTLPFNMEIPPLLLQPLVENAIYHGIQPCKDGGTLGISLYDAGQRLDVVVTNPVPPAGTNSHQKGNHIAQENLKNRLRLAYGDRANLKISKSEHQYRVSFSIPKET
jgi:two-component system sensor histidine kinase AlgZ